MAFDEQTALSYLARAQEAGRLGHAYLITGSDADGREAFGLSVLEKLAGIRVPQLRAAESEHTAVIRPESLSRRIKIDQIRPIERRLQNASGGILKIAVIEEADRLMPQAANAFLKTLEEPPADCLILLLTGAPEQLLETILSRCIRIPLRALPIGDTVGPVEQALLAALRPQFPKPGHNGSGAIALLGAVNSQLSGVRDTLKKEADAKFKAEAKELRKTTDSHDFLKQLEQASKAGAQAAYLGHRRTVFTTLLGWLGDCLSHTAGHPEHLSFATESATTARVGQLLGTEDILRRLTHIEDLFSNLETNVSENLAVEVGVLEAFA